jgi:D-tyrosyl-tRNA(Tyr) deacylase
MIAVIQRASRAEVRVAEQNYAAGIGRGIVILLGVEKDDTIDDARFLAQKIATLRIFEDALGKMNLSVLEAAKPAAALVVSQFTLLGDTRKGRRPSFTDAAPPEKAIPLYEAFCGLMREQGVEVKTGVFGAHMEVELVNDGPVTLIVKSQRG